MSTHTIPIGGSDTINAIHVAIRRLPTETGPIASDGAQVLTYLPDLTTEQTATLELVADTIAASAPLTTGILTAIRADMQVLRDLRQMGRNAFMGLSATERDRALYDAFTATTKVLLAILRDET